MSWQRVGQFSAETRSLLDIDFHPNRRSASTTISTSVFFTGQASYRLASLENPMGRSGLVVQAARIGFYMRHDGATMSTDGVGIVGMNIDGAPLVWRWIPGASTINLRAGWVSGSSSIYYPLPEIPYSFLPSNTWGHIGMVTYMNSANGYTALYINGNFVNAWTGGFVLYRSGQTTPRTTIHGAYAAATPDSTAWHGGLNSWASNNVYLDDIYVDVWTGSDAPPMEPPPSRRFMVAFPNDAGSSAQWTPNTGSNWQAVNEAPPNDDTTHVKATVPGIRDVHEFSDITVPPDHQVRAVIPMVYARKSDAGVDSRVRLIVRRGANEVISDPKFLPTSYGYVWERWTTQPDGSAWSESAVNNAQFGYESAGDF